MNNCERRVAAVSVVAMTMLLGLLCGGCRTVRTAHHTTAAASDTSARSASKVAVRSRVDTVFRDRWHYEYRRGDTIYIYDSVERVRVELKADTLVVHDSVYVSHRADVSSVKETERAQSPRFVQWLLAIGLAVSVAVYALWRLWRR